MSRLYGIHPLVNPLIRQVRIPVPYPIQYVNAYLIAGDNGWTVLDPGIHTREALDFWQSVWAELGSGYGDVERIVVTHHHPDHSGLAGVFQERSGAPVFMSERAKRQAEQLWSGGQLLAAKTQELYALHGMEEEAARQITPLIEQFAERVCPRPEVTPLRSGDFLPLGDEFYEAIETGGHAAGHLSFYRRDTLEMFCGDAVLPRIAPNINYLPEVEANPLTQYLSGLRRLAGCPAMQAYPGHRDSFAEFQERCEELIVHQEKRQRIMLDQAAKAPCTAYECCIALFGARLAPQQLHFAMSETLAHLTHLKDTGLLKAGEHGGVIRFTAQ